MKNERQAGRVFKHKFFNSVLSGINPSREKEDDRLCKRKRRSRKSAARVFPCNIDMPTISYFISCYIDQRGIIGRIGDFPLN